MPRKTKAPTTSKTAVAAAGGSSELFDELVATSKSAGGKASSSSSKMSPASKKAKPSPARDFSMLFSKRGMVQYSFSSSPSPVKLVSLTKPTATESPLTQQQSPAKGKPKGGV